jgi:hypothetical protein
VAGIESKEREREQEGRERERDESESWEPSQPGERERVG